MHEPSFLKRLAGLGPRELFLSFDTFAGVVSLFVIYIWSDGAFPESEATALLGTFAVVSASLFAIVLTGLTIITSFTDKMFVYAWKEVGEYDNIITVFQYNLFLPLMVLVASLALNHILYNGIVMIALSALFVYMVFSLMSLVNLISRYALQRGEFIKQQLDRELQDESDEQPSLSDEQLLHILRKLERLEELEEID